MRYLALSLAFAAACCSQSSNGALQAGYQHMYNCQFAAAHRDFAQFQKKYPDDPMGPVSDAADYLFTEFARLKILRADFLSKNKSLLQGKKVASDPKNVKQFQADLKRTKALADKALRKSPGDESALLARVMRFTLDADYDALIEKKYGKAFAEIKAATRNARVLLSKHPDCMDAKLAIGFENYILSYKSAPVRWFLNVRGTGTSRNKGIRDMRATAEKGNYLKPYAKVLLALAALRDGKRKEARKMLAQLAAAYPQNVLFQSELKKLT